MMSVCNFFKIDGQWVRVFPRIQEKFFKMYQPTEGIMLDTCKAGDAWIWPEPIFIESEADLMKFVLGRKEEHLLSKAFDAKKLGNVRAKLMVKQIRNTSKDRNSTRLRQAMQDFIATDPRAKDWLPACISALYYYATYGYDPYIVVAKDRKTGKIKCSGPYERADIIHDGIDEVDPDKDDIEAILNVKERRNIPFTATIRKIPGEDFNEYKIKWK